MAASGAWVGTIGAGGGIWAKARDELLRPGFKGGGGGKPLPEGVATTAGGAVAPCFFRGTAAGLTLVALTDACKLTWVKVLGSDFWAVFGTGWPVVLTTGFAADVVGGWTADFVAGFALTIVFDTGLLIAFGAGLPTGFAAGLAIDFFDCGLSTCDFLTTAAFAAGLTGFLVATAGFAFAGLATLTARAGLAAAAAFALTSGFRMPLDWAFGAAAGFLIGLTAALAVVLDFFVCAFTACLLWQTAPG